MMRIFMTLVFSVVDPANPVNTVLMEVNFWVAVRVALIERL
jgi:hypothetical protein